MNEIYLDHAATTPVHSEVIEVMMPYLTEKYYNPSALYSPAVQIKNDIENSRKIVADFIGAEAKEIYFTSSGSESNVTAIKGWVENCLMNDSKKMVIITTPIEHKSIMSIKDSIVSRFAIVEFTDVNKDGEVNIDCLERQLEYYSSIEADILVSIQMANNEIGTIQKIGKISNVVHSYNGVFHVDAVQAFGAIPINVKTMGVDMLSASGHKINTPKGIGILYKSKSVEIEPLIYGSQMDSMRGSTENVPYIIGMAKAVEQKKDYVAKGNLLTERKRNIFIKRLEDIGCKLIGSRYNRLPNNINVMMPDGVGGEELLYMLDMSGIMIGVGSACNSHSKEASHVLKAIGLNNSEAAKCIRITLSEETTDEQIDYVLDCVEKAIKLLTME